MAYVPPHLRAAPTPGDAIPTKQTISITMSGKGRDRDRGSGHGAAQQKPNNTGRFDVLASFHRTASEPVYRDTESRGQRGGYRGARGTDIDDLIYSPPVTSLFGSRPAAGAGADDVEDEDFVYKNSSEFADIPVTVAIPPGIQSNLPAVVEFTEYTPETLRRLCVPDKVAHNLIDNLHYKVPTPIQSRSIPLAVLGLDVCASSQTGSGKTVSFLVPVIARILNENLKALNQSPSTMRDQAYYKTVRKGKPLCLILAPTRELVQQITRVSYQLTYGTPVLTRILYGGEKSREQASAISHGCDILVATPGRLMDFMQQGYVDLSFCNFFILDEADRMLDMGFEPDIRRIVQEIPVSGPEGRQSLFFSATFPPRIKAMARDFLSDEVQITVGKIGAACNTIVQHIERIRYSRGMSDYDLYSQKVNILADFLTGRNDNDLCDVAPPDDMPDSAKASLAAYKTFRPDQGHLTLVFTDKKSSCDHLARELNEKYMIPSVALHGDLTQDERQKALRMFRKGEYCVLIATDVAQRGLDIGHVAHVINFDFPSDIDNYVHRIGRTGRVGRVGFATSFVVDNTRSEVLSGLVRILRENKQQVPAWVADRLGSFRGGEGGGGRFGQSGPGGRGAGGRRGQGAGHGGRKPAYDDSRASRGVSEQPVAYHPSNDDDAVF